MTLWKLEKARAPIDRTEAHRLLDQLLDLRERTDPATCTDIDTVNPQDREPPYETVDHEGRTCTVVEIHRGKDACADRAIFLAGDLFIQCAGWAINHKAGQSYFVDIENNNHHDFESMCYDDNGCGYVDDVKMERKLIRDLLSWHMLGRLFPYSVARLEQAIEARDFGEVHELLEPVNTGRHHRPYTLARIRLRAVEHVHFLRGKGMTRERAEMLISEALGVSGHTLRSWETRYLPQAFGKDKVKGATSFAHAAGFDMVQRHVDPDFGKPEKGRPPINGHARLMAKFFDSLDIAELGREYKQALQDGDDDKRT